MLGLEELDEWGREINKALDTLELYHLEFTLLGTSTSTGMQCKNIWIHGPVEIGNNAWK